MGEQQSSDSQRRNQIWAQWRDECARLGEFPGALHFDTRQERALDLSTSHPSGFAQLLSGRVTQLSNLIREPTAFAKALGIARDIEFRAADLAERRGLDTVMVITGIVSWTSGTTRFGAPILLQPASIQGTGQDFQVRLDGAPSVNPELIRALREQFNSTLDAAGLVAAAYSPNAYHPEAAIARLRREFALMPQLQFDQRLILTTYSDAALRASERTRPIPHPVLDAVADLPGAREHIARQSRQVELVTADLRDPASDTLVLDASPEQEKLVAQARSGASFVVRTVPGAGTVQTVVNIAAELVRSGRRVAVVAGSRASLGRVRQRFNRLGLGGVCVRPRHLRSDVVASIARNERVLRESTHAPDPVTFVRLREALLRYRKSLLEENDTFGVSVEQALNELARLAALPDPPQTRVRLDVDTVHRLSGDRGVTVQQLERAAALGEFQYGPSDSAWYGARFDRPERAHDVWAIAKRLHEEDLPAVRETAIQVCADAGLRTPLTTRELSEELELLIGVRGTLDQFNSEVFDRSLTEVIEATGPEGSSGLSKRDRRQLRQLAREYVRPGARVTDLHGAMLRIQAQRTDWNRLVQRHLPPRVPVGLRDLERVFTPFEPDLRAVGQPLDLGRNILDIPFPELETLLASLTTEVGALDNLQERVSLLAGLRSQGLSELLTDFSELHVPSARVRDELEQAWWQSVLGNLLELDGSLLNANTEVLSHLERDFMNADRLHVQGNARALRSELASRWAGGIQDYETQSRALKEALLDRAHPLTAGRLQEAAPALSRILSPVWLLSPYAFAEQIPEGMHFDVVLVLDAGQLGMAELAVPLSQGDQAIVFGDPALLGPSEFSLSPRDEPEPSRGLSAFEELAQALPQRELTRSYRSGGGEIAALVNESRYQGRIRALPSPGAFLGEPVLSKVVVEDGVGVPDQRTGLIEAVPGEVSRVVELVLSAASWHPDDSLMVVTTNERTAAAIRAAVHREAQAMPELAGFFSPKRAEPFLVLTIPQAATRSRERVIFSLGYGRTPHGRMLNQFGPITPDEAGERMLTTVLTRARRHLTVVTCFRDEDIVVDRLQGGARMLGRFLKEPPAFDRAGQNARTQPMLDDLGRRLQRLGLEVTPAYRGVGLAVRTPDGSSAYLIESDADFARGTLREQLRLHPTQLRRMGWGFMRVYSFELFSDPQTVAQTIMGALAPAPAAESAEAPDGSASAVSASGGTASGETA
jgi:hypothetical protein